MARKLGLARLCRVHLLTASKLCVKPLDGLEKRLHFCHRPGVVLGRLGPRGSAFPRIRVAGVRQYPWPGRELV